MVRIATFLFFLVPLLEMIILIEVGGIIGPLPTVGLVVLTAVVGVWLLRLEGLATIARVQDKLSRGEIPETEMLEGVMLIIGGALLLTPGFATDIAGFVCLLPGLRRPLAAKIIRSTTFSSFQFQSGPMGPGQGPGGYQGPERGNRGTIIDGEYEADQPPEDHDHRRLP